MNLLLSLLLTTHISSAALSIAGGENVSLGKVVAGQTQNTSVVLVNTSNEFVVLNTIYIGFTFEQILFLDKDFPGTGGTCEYQLQPFQSCTFIVAFSPNAIGKTVSTFIKFSYTAGNQPQSLQLTLTGQGIAEDAPMEPNPIVPGLLVLEADSVNFGLLKKGTVSTRVITISNSGGSTLSGIVIKDLQTPFAFPGGDYPGTAGSCGATLKPNESCQMLLEFQPSEAGVFTNSLTLQYFDGNSVQAAELELLGRAK
ncbi:MAG: choice-of-anchor D domain-containing protein [Bdellovibrionales bacterium]|nr:choice-of-anchor D domain-containing protein [Bdellovibrionales bacterium]